MTKSNPKKKRPKQPVKPAGTRQSLRKSIICIKTQAEAALSTLDSLSLPETTPRSARSTRSKNSANVGTLDIATESPISFREASEMIATHPSTSTISRWCKVGCRRIKLESTYYGGRRKTSREAVLRFLVACRERGFAGMADGYGLEKAMAEMEELALRRQTERKDVTAGNTSGRGKPTRPNYKLGHVQNGRSKH
jgi:uncharacterized protein DUF1580